MKPGTLELFARLGIAPDAFAADIAGLGVEGGVIRYGMESARPELDERRDGMITASHAGEICRDKSGKGWGVATEKLVLRVAHERLTGKTHKKPTGSAATDWGHEYEDEAALYFEKVTGLKCLPGEFTIAPPPLQIIGGTPDRFLQNGHLQIKCPYTVEVVMANLRAKTPPLENLKQVWFEMICMGEDTVGYWASYDPRITEGAPGKIKIIEITRDDRFLEFSEMVGELERYTLDVCEEMKELFSVPKKKGRKKKR